MLIPFGVNTFLPISKPQCLLDAITSQMALRGVHPSPKPVIQQRSCLGKRGAEILVLFQPAFNAATGDIILSYLPLLEEAGQRIKFL